MNHVITLSFYLQVTLSEISYCETAVNQLEELTGIKSCIVVDSL